METTPNDSGEELQPESVTLEIQNITLGHTAEVEQIAEKRS